MLREKLNDLIKESMLNHDNVRLNVMRSIKTAFTNFEKEGKELTDVDEINLMNKMVSQRKDSIEQYKQGGRQDLAEKEEKELTIINEYLPKEPTEEEIIKLVKETIAKIEDENGAKVEMRNMKGIMAAVKQVYPTADGKLVSSIVKSSIA